MSKHPSLFPSFLHVCFTTDSSELLWAQTPHPPKCLQSLSYFLYQSHKKKLLPTTNKLIPLHLCISSFLLLHIFYQHSVLYFTTIHFHPIWLRISFFWMKQFPTTYSCPIHTSSLSSTWAFKLPLTMTTALKLFTISCIVKFILKLIILSGIT